MVVWHDLPPQIKLEDHHTRHEDGGADEVSVTGLSGLLADDQHVLDAEVTAVAIAKTTVDAQSVLGGISDDTPVAIAVAEQTVVGRITSGNVTALTIAQLWAMLAEYAEMYAHEYATPFTIQKVGVAHGLHGFTQGQLIKGWTFKEGKEVTITAYATSDGGTKTIVSSGATGLANGDIVTIANTTSYDGIYIIEQVVGSTSFVIAKAYVDDDGASVGHAASYLTNPNALGTGLYKVFYSFSSTPSNSNDIFEWEVYLGTTEQVNTETQRKLGAAGDYGVVAMASLISYTAGDKLWVKTQNNSGAGDITNRNANVSVLRVG